VFSLGRLPLDDREAMSTTLLFDRPPSARSTMNCAAWRPIAAPLMRTVVKQVQVGGEFESPKRRCAELPRHRHATRLRLGDHAEREKVELQKTASDRPGPSSSSARAARPLRRVVGAGRRRPGAPARGERLRGGIERLLARRARSSLPETIRELPPALRVEERGDAPTDLHVGKTDQHVDRRRRQVPGLDDRNAGASRRLRPSAECRMPVSTMPSGRRPMMAPSKAHFAVAEYARLAEHELVAALGERVGQGRTVCRKTGRQTVGTTPRPGGCADEARPPARKFGHSSRSARCHRRPSAHLSETCSGELSARDAVIGATPGQLGDVVEG
jgi:hypothetical protein